MGLTCCSTGAKVSGAALEIRKQTPEDKIIAIAGNPNVGKSTLFNSLTGLKQHTGNWPGKTVANAQGYARTKRHGYVLVDIPGTYSLMAHSTEEEVARNFLCFGGSDAVVVVCDATCLERNLNLVLQTLEISSRVLVCVNLMDEAEKKHISVDLEKLSDLLGVPVVGTVARRKKSLRQLMEQLDKLVEAPTPEPHFKVHYPAPVREAAELLEAAVVEKLRKMDSRTAQLSPGAGWLAQKLLEGDDSLLRELEIYYKENILEDPAVNEAYLQAEAFLTQQGISREKRKDLIVSSLVSSAEFIAAETVKGLTDGYNGRDRSIDRLLTSRLTGYPIMAALLALIFWLTIAGANYPSQVLSALLFRFQDILTAAFQAAGAPQWLHGMVVLGMYRVLAWVISVMLPPMAIFFPLFTLLEDAGYLPRVAFNLDKPFQCCHACGKQALTMCMGFGCNAAGIVGCRIIDSPRERLIAMLTNNFVPCNGRFPAMIAVISMFFVGAAGAAETAADDVGASGSVGGLNAGTIAGFASSALSAAILTLFILAGIGMTFLISRLLSMTILKGVPSSFTLELPPYRRPQLGRVILRSVFDRTLFVLGRAAAIAAPAGLLLWIMANVSMGGLSLLARFCLMLDPLGQLMGMDGVILTAFILGLPANEIVLPIIVMAYLAQGNLTEYGSLAELRQVLISNGWTWLTAVNVILFSLMHWPCSTTLLTIRKETGSWKWTALAFLIPAACGAAVCFCLTTAVRAVTGGAL